MTANTKIEWADHTFNPWIGCTRVSPGCDNCYAAVSTPARTKAIQWGAGQPRQRTTSTWSDPKHWNERHAAFLAEHGRRQRVFCASLADVFDNEVEPAWRHDLFNLIEATPNLDWLLLTKRIGNVRDMVSEAGCVAGNGTRYWPNNAKLGSTITSQPEADRDIAKLLAAKAALGIKMVFLSMEPLLGPVRLGSCLEDDNFRCPECDHSFNCVDETECPRLECPLCGHEPVHHGQGRIDWVIVGGESGPGARPMHPEWTRSLRDQCKAAGVPFHFKQWGEWVPYEHSAQPPFLWSQHGHELDGHALPDFESGDGQAQREWHCDFADQLLARRVGKKAAGRLLDGVIHDEFPTHLKEAA